MRDQNRFETLKFPPTSKERSYLASEMSNKFLHKRTQMKSEMMMTQSAHHNDSIDIPPPNFFEWAKTSILTQSLPQFLKFALNDCSKIEKRRIIEDLIYKTTLRELPEYIVSPRNHNNRKDSQIKYVQKDVIKLYYNLQKSMRKFPLVISITEANQAILKQTILIQSFKGEMLFLIKGCEIDSLPSTIQQFLKNFCQFAVVKNLSHKKIVDYQKISKLFHDFSKIIWQQKVERQNLIQFQESLKKIDLFCVKSKLQDDHYYLHTNAIQDHNFDEVSHALKKFNLKVTQFNNSLEKYCKELQTSTIIPSIFSVLLNCYIIMEYQFRNNKQRVIQFLKIIVQQIQKIFNIRPENEDVSSIHFPYMINYAKQCVACKKHQKDQPSIKIKKTKYACQGCSYYFQKQIPLCVLCFKPFHTDTQYYMVQSQKSNKRKDTPPPFSFQFIPDLRKQGKIIPGKEIQIQSQKDLQSEVVINSDHQKQTFCYFQDQIGKLKLYQPSSETKHCIKATPMLSILQQGFKTQNSMTQKVCNQQIVLLPLIQDRNPNNIPPKNGKKRFPRIESAQNNHDHTFSVPKQ